MPSIFSHNGATAARDGLASCTPPPHTSRSFICSFFPLSPCFSISLLLSDLFYSPPFLPLPSHSCPPPPPPSSPTPPSFSRAPSPQSRFASYFQNPLKASHFGIFRSGAAHRLSLSRTLFDSHVRPEPATADDDPTPFTNKPSRDGIC